MNLRDFQPDFNKNFHKISSLINSALDLIRPHFLSLGARVRRLSATQVEVLLPAKQRNQDARGDLLDGVVISAALEAFYLLWKRATPQGEYSQKITGLEWTPRMPLRGDLTIRSEISEIQRETVLAEIGKNKKSSVDTVLHVANSENIICAEIVVRAEIYLMEVLDWK